MSTHRHAAPAQSGTILDRGRRRSRSYLRFGLAGVALLGIGAAATSAAWSDDAWFSSSATAATLQLQASLDGTHWQDADTTDGGASVVIPLSLLDQGAHVDQVLYLRNDGTVPLTLGTPVVAKTGTIFAAPTPATATLGALSTTTLPADPAQTATATFTVTTPDEWADSYQGSTGTVTVHFTAQSSAHA